MEIESETDFTISPTDPTSTPSTTKEDDEKTEKPSVEEDGLETEEETEPFEEVHKDDGLKNEVKFLESRYDTYGYTNLYEVGSAPPKAKNQADKWGNYTFRSTTYFNEKGHIYQRNIDILSRPVKKALAELIVDYPNISFSTATVSLEFPIDVLWYHQTELNELLKKEQETETDDGEETELAQHLGVLMKFLNEEFEPTNKEYHDLTSQGLITAQLLWTLFKPGTLVFSNILTQDRVLRLKTFQGGRVSSLEAVYIDYDGTKFGEVATYLEIPGFTGSMKISDLNAFPLSWHPRRDEIVNKLVKRGDKFVSLQGSHCKKYNGIGINTTMFGLSKVGVNCRVMIDAKTHQIFNPNDSPKLTDLYKAEEKKTSKPRRRRGGRYTDYEYEDLDADPYGAVYHRNQQATEFADAENSEKRLLTLTDDQKLLCNSIMWGFSLGSKKWLQFFVDDIDEVVWNTDSFSKLVLPEETKELICGLVESHIKDASHFDDFVEGKGKGLISVLHGAPGLGKTMTAETVAEYTKSPLYTVSAGSLGTDAYTVETNLEKILQMCTIWKAVLLLDEADVYLEQRSLHDIQRNALVSIFLRLLEYYHGILFLTSNRVETFDEAIQSRIHIAIRYNDLTPEARAQVWKNFIHKIESSGTETALGEEDFKGLAPIELNGRQIKNATRTALGIADRRGEKIGLEHLKLVLGVVDAFERDMVSVKKD
ncbi:hypothetical protein AA313_de0205629 [Arthrobotrys entomopaga]|nr:hypothetical protein AA313_de0205629 [Arthrobotrys entomopaga]